MGTAKNCKKRFAPFRKISYSKTFWFYIHRMPPVQDSQWNINRISVKTLNVLYLYGLAVYKPNFRFHLAKKSLGIFHQAWLNIAGNQPSPQYTLPNRRKLLL